MQYFTPNRYGSFIDILINMSGAVGVALIALVIHFIRRLIAAKKTGKSTNSQE